LQSRFRRHHATVLRFFKQWQPLTSECAKNKRSAPFRKYCRMGELRNPGVGLIIAWPRRMMSMRVTHSERSGWGARQVGQDPILE
jgi:hypothetical protein